MTFSYLAKLNGAPHNSLTNSAWQTYFMLTSPTSDENLIALRENYFGQVGEILAASDWANHPSAYSGCDLDLNNDGRFECVLSNLHLFAILDPAGARLTNLFFLNGIGPHQLVGPSSQFTIGLSDPSEWQPNLGQAADPSVIPGAFSDDTLTWTIYASHVTTGTIDFTSPDGSRDKSYTLTDNGLEITYASWDPCNHPHSIGAGFRDVCFWTITVFGQADLQILDVGGNQCHPCQGEYHVTIHGSKFY